MDVWVQGGQYYFFFFARDFILIYSLPLYLLDFWGENLFYVTSLLPSASNQSRNQGERYCNLPEICLLPTCNDSDWKMIKKKTPFPPSPLPHHPYFEELGIYSMFRKENERMGKGENGRYYKSEICGDFFFFWERNSLSLSWKRKIKQTIQNATLLPPLPPPWSDAWMNFRTKSRSGVSISCSVWLVAPVLCEIAKV